MDPRERTGQLEATVRAALRGFAAQTHTSMPGIIQSFDATKMTCTVQPSIQGKVQNQDGSYRDETLPLLLDCPVVFPHGGGSALTLPLAAGDECVVMFSERCIDAWWSQGGIQPQAEIRFHDLSDGFCIPGPWSQPRKPTGIIPGAVQLGSPTTGGLTISSTIGAQLSTPGGGAMGINPSGAIFMSMQPGAIIVPNAPASRGIRIFGQPAVAKTCLLEDYGLVGDYLQGSGTFNPAWTDNLAAWNAVMANATVGDTFYIPMGANGECYAGFSGPPVMVDGTRLFGYGRSVGGFVRAYNPGGGSLTPFLDIGLHTVVKDMLIFCGLGTHGGFALSRVATSADNAAQDNQIENVFVTGLGALTDGDFTAACVIDSTNGAAHFGSRSVLVNACQFSRYTGWGLKVAAHNGGNFINTDFAANTVGFSGVDVYATGSASNPNNSCQFSGPSLDTILMEYSDSCIVNTGAVGDVTVDATCSSVLINCGFFNSVPVLNGSNIRLQGGKFTFDSTL